MVTQQDLTRSLPRLTSALSAECAVVLNDVAGDAKEWHEIVVRGGISLPMVARLSTLAFMGPEACQDREWIDIAINFTVNIILANLALQKYPRWLRPLANYCVSECRLLQAQERRAMDIIDEKLAARRKLRGEEASQGRGAEAQPSDALDWFQAQHQKLGGEYNPALTQLMLSFAAIHTTADLLTQVILDLALHQEMLEPLRKEVTEALDGGPIDKMATHKMKLLDSVMKESQRMKPMQIGELLPAWADVVNDEPERRCRKEANVVCLVAFMERGVLEDVTLSDGIQLKRDTATMIMPRMRDPTLYEKPDEYDGYRFYRLRQEAGNDKVSALSQRSLSEQRRQRLTQWRCFVPVLRTRSMH